MVETSAKRAPPRRDWLAIREAYRAGMSLEGLALREGLGVTYLKEGLMWTERIAPATRTGSLKLRLEAHLEAAEAALARGEMADAEKRARAVTALLKAAMSVDDWARLAESARRQEANEAQSHAHTREALLEELRRRLSRLDAQASRD
jgi:transcription elongation GreA/GreB family factor